MNDYLPVEQARETVRRCRRVAEYVPGAGAKCILCGEWARAENGGKVLKGGQKVRTHFCPACGKKFTSQENFIENSL